MATWALEAIHAKIKVHKTIQGEQRITYLTNQRHGTSLTNNVQMQITKMKPKDMAGPVAALDAPPLAAVFVVPRVKDAQGVAGDAALEGQQGVPLPWYAACAGRTAGRPDLKCIGGQQGGGG